MDRTDVGALVRSAVDGDAAAWKSLVEGLSPLVWSVVRSHRLSEADGHEVYHTVWFRFAQHLGRIRELEKAESWLASTTRHECLKRLRRLRPPTPTNNPQLLDRVSEERTPEPSFLDSEEAAAETERIRQMWQEFEDLGERCRQLLRMLMGSPPHSYQEISAALGIAVGSIGPMRQRCLRRLRARVEARASSRTDTAAFERSAPWCNFHGPAAGDQDAFSLRDESPWAPAAGSQDATPPSPFELHRLASEIAETGDTEPSDESHVPAPQGDESHDSSSLSRSDRDRDERAPSDDDAGQTGDFTTDFVPPVIRPTAAVYFRA